MNLFEFAFENENKEILTQTKELVSQIKEFYKKTDEWKNIREKKLNFQIVKNKPYIYYKGDIFAIYYQVENKRTRTIRAFLKFRKNKTQLKQELLKIYSKDLEKYQGFKQNFNNLLEKIDNTQNLLPILKKFTPNIPAKSRQQFICGYNNKFNTNTSIISKEELIKFAENILKLSNLLQKYNFLYEIDFIQELTQEKTRRNKNSFEEFESIFLNKSKP